MSTKSKAGVRVREEMAHASHTIERRTCAARASACSWGNRMPWLPIRQDPRLVEHLRPAGGGSAPSGHHGGEHDSRRDQHESDRSPQCRYASLSTLASTNSSLRELVVGTTPRSAPVRSLLDISIRALRRELMRLAFDRWVKGATQQAFAPRYFRCGNAGRRYGVVSELCRGVHGRVDTRIEQAFDLSRRGGRGAVGSPTTVVLKVYKPLASSPAAASQFTGCNSVAQIADQERAALKRCAHPHVLRVLDNFVETPDHMHEACAAAETLDPDANIHCSRSQVYSLARDRGLDPMSNKAAFANHIIVLEHAGGGSLDHYLQNIAVAGSRVGTSPEHSGSISIWAAVDLCTQLFEAVAHCHSAPVATAHRDIKPANCLLFPTRDPLHRSGWLLKLSDFGLAKTMATTDAEAHNRRVETFTFDIGTEPYQSPEICGLRYDPDGHAVVQLIPGPAATSIVDSVERGEADAEGYNPFQSDLWSLACTVYEICTLKMACRCAPDAALATAALDHDENPKCQGPRADDDSCMHRCQWLKQASVPSLPAPPLFAEEFDTITRRADLMGAASAPAPICNTGSIGVELRTVRTAVDEVLHGWSLPTAGLRPSVAAMIRDGSSWHALIHMTRTPQRQQRQEQVNDGYDEQSESGVTTADSVPSSCHPVELCNCSTSLIDRSVGATVDDAADHQLALQEQWSVDVQPPDRSDFFPVLPCTGDAAAGDDGHRRSTQHQDGMQRVCFGEEVYAMLPFARVDASAQPDHDDTAVKQSARSIAAMESQLRGIYCAAELAELEITLFTQLLAQAGGTAHHHNTSNASPSQHTDYHNTGDISCDDPVIAIDGAESTAGKKGLDNLATGDVGLEDRIVWHLVHNVLCHRRANYAKRVDGLRLFVRAGLYKTYAAQGFHLQLLQPLV